jgi:hypothetical protein
MEKGSAMDDKTIMVSIFDADQQVEARACRLVYLPDGTRAALWRGLAWPIAAGERIDVSGPAFPLLQPSPNSAPLFGIIDGADEAWLILDGSVALRDTAAGVLREAGIDVLRSGPWLGDPIDGVVGSDFIRFARPKSDNLRETIGRVLAGKVTPAPPSPGPVERLRALTVELIEARAALARTPSRLEMERTGPALGAIEDELARVRQENAALLKHVTELQSELAAAQESRTQSSRPTPIRVQDEVAKIVAGLRPDLCFLRDSLTVLWGEFSDRGGLCRAFSELGSASLSSNWKRVRGASGWWERHVSNGQDDSGRIYAHSRDGGWDLLISHKAQQGRDISWLDAQTSR